MSASPQTLLHPDCSMLAAGLTSGGRALFRRIVSDVEILSPRWLRQAGLPFCVRFGVAAAHYRCRDSTLSP